MILLLNLYFHLLINQDLLLFYYLEHCNFYLDGFGILPFHNKEAPSNPRIILPNIGYYHAVVNNSNEDRYHMIVHAEKNKEWWNLEDESLR